jgi:hypothetical protein
VVTGIFTGVLETVRYTYRLRPGRIAQAALLAEWGRCRWLWNEAVHQQKTGRKPTFGKLSKMLTEARARLSWLRDGSQVAQQQTLRTYGSALEKSFTVKGRGRLRRRTGQGAAQDGPPPSPQKSPCVEGLSGCEAAGGPDREEGGPAEHS